MSNPKPQHEKKTKAGGSVATGRGLGRGLATGRTTQDETSKKVPSKPVIASNAEECEHAIREAMILHEGTVLQFLPDDSQPRFILKKLADGSIKAELGDSLSNRVFELAWKIPPELHGLVNGLMHLTNLPRNLFGNDTGQMLLAMAITERADPIILRPASTTIGMLELHLGDDLKRMLKQPQGEARNKTAKVIQKRLCAAVEALNKQSQRKPHGGGVAFEAPVGQGQMASMPLPLSAILEAQKFVEREQCEPTKAELRKLLKAKHKDAIPKNPRDGFWTPIWKQAGLAELNDAKPWSYTQKSAKKSAGQLV